MSWLYDKQTFHNMSKNLHTQMLLFHILFKLLSKIENSLKEIYNPLFIETALALPYTFITSRNLHPLFHKSFRPYFKKIIHFLQKRLTSHSKFASKPIDYILFQSTVGDFFVTL